MLARVGNYNLPLNEIKKLTICPKHRHNLGQYWRPLKTCQYPDHEGRKIALRCKNPVNWQMGQKIQIMFITPVQLEWRKFFFCFFFVVVCLFVFQIYRHPIMKAAFTRKNRKKTKIKTKVQARLNILSS